MAGRWLKARQPAICISLLANQPKMEEKSAIRIVKIESVCPPCPNILLFRVKDGHAIVSLKTEIHKIQEKILERQQSSDLTPPSEPLQLVHYQRNDEVDVVVDCDALEAPIVLFTIAGSLLVYHDLPWWKRGKGKWGKSKGKGKSFPQ